jgi:hypothetical protein
MMRKKIAMMKFKRMAKTTKEEMIQKTTASLQRETNDSCLLDWLMTMFRQWENRTSTIRNMSFDALLVAVISTIM